MKLGNIVNPAFHTALQKLLGEALPLKTAFKLKKIAQSAQGQMDRYEEVRKEAVVRLGPKKEDGSIDSDEKGTVKLSDENMQTFIKEMNELAAVDYDLGYVTLEELGNKVVITAGELFTLGDVIKAD